MSQQVEDLMKLREMFRQAIRALVMRVWRPDDLSQLEQRMLVMMHEAAIVEDQRRRSGLALVFIPGTKVTGLEARFQLPRVNIAAAEHRANAALFMGLTLALAAVAVDERSVELTHAMRVREARLRTQREDADARRNVLWT